MVKDLFETLQAVVEGFGVCLVSPSSAVCLGSSKLVARSRTELLAISTLLYKKSLVYTTTSDREMDLILIGEFFLGTFFQGRSSSHLPAKLSLAHRAPCTAPQRTISGSSSHLGSNWRDS